MSAHYPSCSEGGWGRPGLVAPSSPGARERLNQTAVSENTACQCAGESHKRAQTSVVTAGTVIMIMATIKPMVVMAVMMMMMMMLG